MNIVLFTDRVQLEQPARCILEHIEITITTQTLCGKTQKEVHDGESNQVVITEKITTTKAH